MITEDESNTCYPSLLDPKVFIARVASIDSRFDTLTFDELKCLYEALSSDVVASVRFAEIECKRRIAEQVLIIAVRKNAPLPTVKQAWKECAQIGFTDCVQECIFTTILCRHLIAVQDDEVAPSLLQQILNKYNDAQITNNPELLHYITIISSLIENVEPKR